MSAVSALFRTYRVVVAWFAVVLVGAEVVVAGVIATHSSGLDFSLWLEIVGSGGKYWLLVTAIVLVAMQLRQFVTSGVTRREFLRASAIVLLALAVTFAVAVVLGHATESAILGAAGKRADGYPVLTASGVLGEFGHELPAMLAWPISGAIIAIGFYRFRPVAGVVTMVLGSIPAVVTDLLVTSNDLGQTPDHLPYPVALLLSLVATAAGAVALRRLVSDVPIRRAAG